MKTKTPFHRPFQAGSELQLLAEVLASGHTSGNGPYTHLCQQFFEARYGFHKCLLTHSCTAALEMAALLLDIQPGDEVIVPSYTFVSTANAFALRGARIVFADSQRDHPNMDVGHLESLLSPRTKAIVPVHYAGTACDMDTIEALAKRHGLWIVEDAAQAIDNYHLSPDQGTRPLGSIGHLAAFSFHETKNISCGEGGMLLINDDRFAERAEILWEKGTNRSAFRKGSTDAYTWMDLGSSFLPPETTAALLWAQLEHIDAVQVRRRKGWAQYHRALEPLEASGIAQRPRTPAYSGNNAHAYYLLFRDAETRTTALQHLNREGVDARTHYRCLHHSPFYTHTHGYHTLPRAERHAECLLRLPLYDSLPNDDITEIAQILTSSMC